MTKCSIFLVILSVCIVGINSQACSDNEMIIVSNEELTKRDQISGNPSENIVQISPQHVNLKLRVNQPHKMRVSFAQVKDLPVDVYVVMDLSPYMSENMTMLSNLYDSMIDILRESTTDYRIGFGSYVRRKQYMTYTHGFKNEKPLSAETKSFNEYISEPYPNQKAAINTPSGGLDALLQAVVCNKEIGWRQNARRVIVYVANYKFKIAGDGKFDGVFTPNDGLCHMEGNLYTHSLLQDPQIDLKVIENAINIIFVAPKAHQKLYRKLSDIITGSSTAELSQDSSNVVELIREQYNKISTNVELKDTASGTVKISYFSDCFGYVKRETNKCDGLKVGDVVEFETEITVTSCPANQKDYKQTFKIHPVGVNQALTVDLEMLCSCD